MIDTHSISLKTIVKEFDLQVVHAATDFDFVRITVEDISRPGIQLSGYFDHFRRYNHFDVGVRPFCIFASSIFESYEE